MSTFEQIVALITTAVMVLSVQVKNLSQLIRPASQLAQVPTSITVKFQQGTNNYNGAVDRYLYGTYSGIASPSTFVLRISPYKFYYLIWFDLSSIPDNATVISATLSFKPGYVYTNPTVVNVRKIIDPDNLGVSWTQGWSNVGTANTVSSRAGATTRYRNQTGPSAGIGWTLADSGNENVQTILNAAAQEEPGSAVTYNVGNNNIWYDHNVTQSVQDWVNNPSSNQGFLVYGNDDANIHGIRGIGNPTIEDRPYLTVTYKISDNTPPPSPPPAPAPDPVPPPVPDPIPDTTPPATAPLDQFNIYPYIKGNNLANFPAYSDTPGPDPAKNQCSEDPFYFSKVCKAIDASEGDYNNMIRPSYMRWSSMSGDNSRYFVNSGKFVNGTMLHFFNTADNSPINMASYNGHENWENRWDLNDNNKIYYIGNGACTLYEYNVNTRVSTAIHNFKNEFPSCGYLWMGGEGTHYNQRYWALIVKGPYQHSYYPLLSVIVYDRETDSIIGKMDKAKFVQQGGNPDVWDFFNYGPNMVDIAPSGDRVLLLWPAIKYPAPVNINVSGYGDNTLVSEGGTKVTVNTGTVLNWTYGYKAGDKFILTCGGSTASLTGLHSATSVSKYSLSLDISGSGMADGIYTGNNRCSGVRPAVESIVVSGGIATINLGFTNHLRAGKSFTVYNAAHSGLNGTKTSLAVTTDTITFRTTVPDGVYANQTTYIRWSEEGSSIDDNDFGYPALKSSNNIGNDGPHVYNFDFSNPIKVCNTETHSGWAWYYNGDPVYVCQINNDNWAKAPADTIGFTNIYTGAHTTMIYHRDIGWSNGGWHFGRFYDRSIRGWAAVAQPSGGTSGSRFDDTLWFIELKPWQEQPRVWRAAKLHTKIYSYNTEAHGSLNVTATKFMWGGNWNNQTSEYPINTYWVDLPDKWWVTLADTDYIPPAVPASAPEPPPVIIVNHDLNRDGLVNSIDISLMFAKWNLNYPDYDMNKDGNINSLDYEEMTRNWSL